MENRGRDLGVGRPMPTGTGGGPAARVPVHTVQTMLTVQHVFHCSAPGHEQKEGIQSIPCAGWEFSQLMPFPTLPHGWVVVAGSVFCDQHKFVLVDEDGQTYRLMRQSGSYGGYLQACGVFPAMAGWFQRATDFLKGGK